MRLILNAHSRIAIPEELVYLHSFIAGIPIEDWRKPPLSPEAYTGFVMRFLTETCKTLEGLDVQQVAEAVLRGPMDFRRPYALALVSWAEALGKSRWGEKTPGNLFYADVLLEMFPEARFIHMVRDPRAGIASMQKAHFFSDDVVFNALAWRKQTREGRALFERWVPPAQRITVRYEDLVSAPGQAVRAVCAFLEEDFEPGMMRFYEHAENFMKPEAAADFNAAATRPIDPTLNDKWRRALSLEEVAVVQHICNTELVDGGYEPEPVSLSLAGHLDVLVKQAYARVQCWRHRRIRHFTVRDRLFARTRGRLSRKWALLRGQRILEDSGAR